MNVEDINKEIALPLIDKAIVALQWAMKGEENTLYMFSYIEDRGDLVEGKEIHTCGTAACICGYMALKDKVLSGNSSVFDIAEEYAAQFDQVLGGYLGKSIWYESEGDRVYYAEEAELFSPEELKHPHLTTKSTLQDALSYLELVRGKVKAL